MAAARAEPVDEIYVRALALYERGDATAASLLEAVLAAAPNHAAARYKLANLQQEAGALDAAAAGYEAVLAGEPGHAQALNNLGAVRQVQGNLAGAEACYRKAIRSEPGLVAPAANLGRLLLELGRVDEAAAVFAEAGARGLDQGLFGHLLAAATGGDSERAPQSYVRETFDAFAAGFEQRVAELDYRVPHRLCDLVRRRVTTGAGLEVLDLGCGSGLVGEALGQMAARLVGVDLSARMLDQARKKSRYAELHQADIVDWLAATPVASIDLVMAADVFIYIGDLGRVFGDCARALRSGGLLVFSVETRSGDGWQLQPSGRYAQSDAYIARLAELHGLAVCVREAAEIRRGVEGALYLLEKKLQRRDGNAGGVENSSQ